MRVYRIDRVQTLPLSREKAWEFFSSPLNLQEITPADMHMQVLSPDAHTKTYAGKIIEYIVRPVAGIPMRWLTEITQVDEGYRFIDEQRFGPYAFWHHQHIFEADGKHTRMIDCVHYALPLGVLGKLAHAVFVQQKLKHIFDYRAEILAEKFKAHEQWNL